MNFVSILLIIKGLKDKDTNTISHYENVPFDIPDSWVWTTIENVLEVNMGQSPDGSFVSSEFFSGMEFHQGKTFFSDKYLSVSNIKTTKPNKIAPRNSILLCVRAPVGVVNITPRTICIGRGLSSISSQFGMDADFIYYWLYTFSDSFNEKATGSTFTAISGEIIKNSFFPLPPLCEQTRITRKIIDIFSTLKDIEASLL